MLTHCGNHKMVIQYPPSDLHNNSWEEARKYLGWNDGFFHAPHIEKGVE
ncbi:hypothetical protein HNW13_017765 [Shewanella sp. BF02_Schw]|nr:hypothetical protein [Shewanella sp. BF02_Schw]MBO1897587.1 hypothetical protein [Shewanella sp. BF02_Schw]